MFGSKSQDSISQNTFSVGSKQVLARITSLFFLRYFDNAILIFDAIKQPNRSCLTLPLAWGCGSLLAPDHLAKMERSISKK